MSENLRSRLAEICEPMPGAEKSDPWGGGHDAWKVGGKMFACIGAKLPGVAVKTPDIDTATMLIDAGIGQKAPYFHKSWVLLPEDVDGEELRHRVEASYGIVRRGLTKKVQAALEENEKS